jgi:hypothetical protein
MMSSSDGRSVAGKTAVAVDPGNSAAATSKTRHAAGDGSAATSAEVGKLAPAGSEPDRLAAANPDTGSSEPGKDDPWFGVAPGRANEPAQPATFDPEATLVDWFLPGGRAALLPDSMTVASGEDESGHQQRPAPAPAGVPPWAADAAGSAAGEPPPWENGPWPGPGGVMPSRPPVARSDRSRQSAARQDEAAGPWTPRTVLVTGLLPLVVPGLVVGLIGLRRTRSGEPGRLASVLALVASLVWAVVIVVVVVAGTGGSSGGCSYPAAVHQAYATAMADLKGSAPAATQATDLGLATSRANSAATAASEIQVRSALYDMAADLQQARTDVIANRPVPSSLRAQLAADGNALTAACPA